MQPIRQHHLLMVRFPSPERGSLHFPIEANKGVMVNASYINAQTGEKVRDVRLHLTGPQDLHFAASGKEKFRGWWYIQQFDQRAGVHYCSCAEYQCHAFCVHVANLPTEVVA